MAPLVSAPYGVAFAGRRVFVTGAYGLLGAWLVRARCSSAAPPSSSCAATSGRAAR